MEHMTINTPESVARWVEIDRRYREGAALLTEVRARREVIAGFVPAPRAPSLSER